MSGRAAGKKHAPRADQGNPDEGFLKSKVDPDSLEGHKLGMSKRVQGAPSPIPGGRDHILNAQTFRQRPEAPSPADFIELPDQNAHGVPPETHTGATRAQIMRGKTARGGPDQYYAETRTPVRPVPVWIVANEESSAVYRTASPRSTSVPANDQDPIPLCGRDPQRVQILLLNEDPANGVRIAATLSDLNDGGGGLLPAGMGSYLRLPTQDTLYAISATGSAATLSIIQVWDTSGTGL